jgi:hypothetical protein
MNERPCDHEENGIRRGGWLRNSDLPTSNSRNPSLEGNKIGVTFGPWSRVLTALGILEKRLDLFTQSPALESFVGLTSSMSYSDTPSFFAIPLCLPPEPSNILKTQKSGHGL